MYIKVLILVLSICFATGCFHRRHYSWSKNPDSPYQGVATSSFKDLKGNESALFYQSMGTQFFNQNELSKARNCFSNAVKLDSKLYWSWFYLGLMDINNSAGYEYLKKSAGIKPDFAPNYYWMAYYQCRMYQDQKAIVLFKKYLKLAKNQRQEKDRLGLAEEVLKELLSGQEGEFLKEIRQL